MAPPTRLSIAKPDIIKAFEKALKRVWTAEEINGLMIENAEFWRLAKSQTLLGFIQFLLRETDLKEINLPFPSRKITRYLWKDASVFEIALSLKPGVYLTHYAAVYLHGLTEQVPKTIYVNKEQPYQSQSTELEQKNINLAFSRNVRVSHDIAEFRDYRLCIVHGAKTGSIGVVLMEGPEGETLRVTGIERTLIDIAVRPVYSGGVFEVLKAYRLAHDKKISINRMSAMLKDIGHAYPYHQVIGFYLERSSVYSEQQIGLFRKFPIKFDFYLEHGMKDPDYCERWRLYFPKGL